MAGYDIYILEDDLDLMQSYMEFTRKFFTGSEVRYCSSDNGDLSQTVLESTKFDLLLFDNNVPGINGIDLILKIRDGNGANKNTPIFLITGFLDHAYNFLEKRNDVENVLVLSKPLEFERLSKLMKIHLKKAA